jgi:hypothetical protein
MLHRLGVGDHRGVSDVRIVGVLNAFLAFLNDAFDRRTGLALRLLAKDFEHLLETLDLTLGLLQMVVEGLLQLGGIALLRHLGQRLQNLLFGEVDVLEVMQE